MLLVLTASVLTLYSVSSRVFLNTTSSLSLFDLTYNSGVNTTGEATPKRVNGDKRYLGSQTGVEAVEAYEQYKEIQEQYPNSVQERTNINKTVLNTPEEEPSGEKPVTNDEIRPNLDTGPNPPLEEHLERVADKKVTTAHSESALPKLSPALERSCKCTKKKLYGSQVTLKELKNQVTWLNVSVEEDLSSHHPNLPVEFILSASQGKVCHLMSTVLRSVPS